MAKSRQGPALSAVSCMDQTKRRFMAASGLVPGQEQRVEGVFLEERGLRVEAGEEKER